MVHRDTSNTALSDVEETQRTWGASSSPVRGSPLPLRGESAPMMHTPPRTDDLFTLPEVRSLSSVEGIPALSSNQADFFEQLQLQLQQQQQVPTSPPEAELERLQLGQQGTAYAAAPQQHVQPAAAAAPAGPEPQAPPGHVAAPAAPAALLDPFGGAAATGAAALAAPPELLGGAAAAAAAVHGAHVLPGPVAASAAPAAPAGLLDPFGGAAAAGAAPPPAAAAPAQVAVEPFAFAAPAAQVALAPFAFTPPAAAAALPDPFAGAAAAGAAAPPPAAQAAFNPFGAAAGAPAPLDPFGGAAAAPPDPFGGAAAPPAAAQAAFNPFGAAAGAPALLDPFAQVAAGLPPLPPPPAGLAPPPEADFIEEYAAWGPVLHDVAAAAGGAGGGGGGGGIVAAAGAGPAAAGGAGPAAAGAGPALVLPTHINTCEIGEDGDCIVHVGQELARGSFGTVYPGLYYDDPVAVKMLRVAGFGVDEATLQQRILREVQLQARAVSHSGVVKFVAVCFSPPAIVMEMCACSLSERIINHWATQQAAQQQQPQQQPELPSWRLVVQLLRQAAAALAFLHRHGQTILHNDLRAANMVLTPSTDANSSTGPWKLKICDFGLAVAAGAAGAVQVPEVTHASWRAPELDQSYSLADSMYTVTSAADVYALGCVLREMLVPSFPQPSFPAADARLPALADPPPVGLEPLFQACVQQQAQDRPTAQVVWRRLAAMQVA